MKEIADKEQNTIKDIVKRVFGYDLEEVEFNGDKLRIVVEGKAYGDGYSSYVRAKYKDGVWQESQIGGNLLIYVQGTKMAYGRKVKLEAEATYLQ